MKTYTVYFSVPAEHHYEVKVKASSAEAAEAAVEKALERGNCPEKATPTEQYENYRNGTIQESAQEDEDA
jgi:hypothetical protein